MNVTSNHYRGRTVYPKTMASDPRVLNSKSIEARVIDFTKILQPSDATLIRLARNYEELRRK